MLQSGIADAWGMVLTVFASGCVGGLVNAVLAGQLELPKRDTQAGVYRPGWLGNLLIGGVAAAVFWGLYGPMASAILMGPANAGGAAAILRVSDLVGALLTGVGGGRLLTAELEKRVLARETQQFERTKNELVLTVKDLIQR